MSQKIDEKVLNSLKASLRRGAENTFRFLEKSWNGAIDDLRAKYEETLERIDKNPLFPCECCGKSMPFSRLNKNTFLTTCSEECEKSIQPASDEEESFIRENCEEEDVLPGKLRILASLNSLQYGNRQAKIVAANIEKVEDMGAEAMVTIFHNYADVPKKLRISAFAPIDQSAIMKSVIEEKPFLMAKRLIVKEALSRIASPRLLQAFC